MNPPRFSVVISFLDAERHLHDAIRSVVDQDFDDWELLLVDDGSKDASRSIAETFARSDARITAFSHPDNRNHGLPASRNLAVRLARGTFVTFLDADDYYYPDRLSTHDQVLKEHPGLDSIYGRTDWLYDQDGRIEHEDLGPFCGTLVPPPRLIDTVLFLHQGDVPCVSSVTMSRRIVLESGGFEEDFRLYEDQTLWVKIFSRYPTMLIDHRGAVYRQHSASMSSRAERLMPWNADGPRHAGLQFALWTQEYLTVRGLSDPALDVTLSRAVREARGKFPRRFVGFFLRHFSRIFGSFNLRSGPK